MSAGFSIGPLRLAGRAVLAPMAGVTDSAFRGLCLEQGAALVYTEMVSAKALCYQHNNCFCIRLAAVFLIHILYKNCLLR